MPDLIADKLRAGEQRWRREKNERVVFFAQQGEDGPIKIGFSWRVAERLLELGAAAGKTLRLLGTMPGVLDFIRKHAEPRMSGWRSAASSCMCTSSSGPARWDPAGPAPRSDVEDRQRDEIVVLGARALARIRANVDAMTSFILSAILAAPLPSSDTCPLLESLDLEVLCQEHPLQRPAACGVQSSLDECVGMLKVLTACGLTECQYINCANELTNVGCFERPTVCEVVVACLDG